MTTDELRSMVDRHAELEKERKAIMVQMDKLSVEVKKSLIQDKFYDALSINWSMLRRIAR